MTPTEFKTLLLDHDWTYMYSDDHRVYTKGRKEAETIQHHMRNNELFTKMYGEYRGTR